MGAQWAPIEAPNEILFSMTVIISHPYQPPSELGSVQISDFRSFEISEAEIGNLRISEFHKFGYS